MAKPRLVDGNDVFYHYLQKDMQKRDIWLFQMFVARLVASLAVWLHPAYYDCVPFLLPHVVRDNACRKRGLDKAEAWSSADDAGYLRDDNSLIKQFRPGWIVACERGGLLDGQKLGRGWVASHVWRGERESEHEPKAKRNAWVNSFVPNLVWLPEQLSKLSDRASSFTQAYLQAVSRKLYAHRKVQQELKPFVRSAWKQLPAPPKLPEEGLPEQDELQFFEFSEPFVTRRVGKMDEVLQLFDALQMRARLPRTSVSTRYRATLPGVGWRSVRPLASRLKDYVRAVGASAD